jgi:uncharacterized protein YbjQ (UPF0145 family)
MSIFSGDGNDDVDEKNELSAQPGITLTGLSGNEIYCTAMAGYRPGDILMGNSVYSLGVIGGITSGVRTTVGGEITQFTNMISEGRRLSLQRFEKELQDANASGAAGVTSELIFHSGHIEFLSVGSSLFNLDGSAANGVMTSAADGQELFCQIDAGFQPLRLAFGNVAYSIGVGRNLLGNIRQMGHGEVKQFSDVFNTTRNTALQRIIDDAKTFNANSVVGIRTTILPVGQSTMQEMMMLGTASYNPNISELANQLGGVVTSDLTSEEMWNVTKLGYAPMKLVLGTSVYSLGVVGGLKAALRGVAKGEINTLTKLVYGAREESLKKVQDQAAAIGSDMVIGIKTYIYQLGGDLIEFLAIGTAVKRVEGMAPRSEQLPPQAIIRDKDTFVNTADLSFGADLSHQASGINRSEDSTVNP